jgi:hypothetical protein
MSVNLWISAEEYLVCALFSTSALCVLLTSYPYLNSHILLTSCPLLCSHFADILSFSCPLLYLSHAFILLSQATPQRLPLEYDLIEIACRIALHAVVQPVVLFVPCHTCPADEVDFISPVRDYELGLCSVYHVQPSHALRPVTHCNMFRTSSQCKSSQ